MRQSKAVFITRCALFTALLCLLSPIAIPVGPVPVTLSVFVVMLTALVLGWKSAAAAVGIYVLLGCCGLPVFSAGRGGVAMLIGPTGGYIWSYVPMAMLISWLGREKPLWAGILASLGGLVLCYLCGTAQYALVTGSSFYAALSVCVLPFVVFDVIKAVCATLLAKAVLKRLQGKTGTD